MNQLTLSTLLVFTILSQSTANSIDVKKYLEKYGYKSKYGYSDSIEDSLKSFQANFGLKVIGKLNKETVNLIKTPRCGVSDLLYNQPGNKWEREELSYYYVNYTPDLERQELKRLTKKAFQYWADVTPLTFTEKSIGNILIYYGSGRHHDTQQPCYAPFDGRGGELAHAFYPPDGRLHFDEDEVFTSNTTYGVNYLWVATHEIGHLLGLEHDTSNRSAVMYPYYKKYNPEGMKLHENDIKRIQELYGSGGLYPTLHPPVCEDKLSNCRSIKSYCNSEIESWKDLVRYKCKLTCGFCIPSIKPTQPSASSSPPTTKTTTTSSTVKPEVPRTESINRECKDDIANCAFLKTYCDTDQYAWKHLMRIKCKKTCKFC